jgi:hypothetical protein
MEYTLIDERIRKYVVKKVYDKLDKKGKIAYLNGIKKVKGYKTTVDDKLLEMWQYRQENGRPWYKEGRDDWLSRD